MAYRENKVNEINIEVPEGYIIDEENSSFTCIKFKKEEKKEVTCWEDLNISLAWATEEQEQAEVALKKLSQLMKDVNGDWIPDWSDDNCKFIIRPRKNTLDLDNFCSYQYFLSFPTKEIRDKFLKNHEELIMKAKPLL